MNKLAAPEHWTVGALRKAAASAASSCLPANSAAPYSACSKSGSTIGLGLSRSKAFCSPNPETRQHTWRSSDIKLAGQRQNWDVQVLQTSACAQAPQHTSSSPGRSVIKWTATLKMFALTATTKLSVNTACLDKYQPAKNCFHVYNKHQRQSGWKHLDLQSIYECVFTWQKWITGTSAWTIFQDILGSH